jgi:hypothetical protein
MSSASRPPVSLLYLYAVGAYSGNGNILSHTDSVTGSWLFGYDTLNRLTSTQNTATTSVGAEYTGAYGCWTYDPFGNRTLEAYSSHTSTPCVSGANDNLQYTSTSVSSAGNNRLSSLTYDASGNVVQNGSNAYAYDAEGRLCAVQLPSSMGRVQYQWSARLILYQLQ